MIGSNDDQKPAGKRIVIGKNGPYHVMGGVPLVRKTQVVSEYGEPLTWKREEVIETEEEYWLCRCGHSQNKPFCDRSHKRVGFDGTECADTGPTAARQGAFRGGTRLIVKKDPTLCMEAGFCGRAWGGIAQFVAASDDDSGARSLAIAMVERCPSGALTYRIEANGPDIEPDLPQQIADTTEITSDGPIAGPLWVMGGITIERSDGQPMETRNRVTLCNCGLSANKPLCDGTHRHEAARAARLRRAR